MGHASQRTGNFRPSTWSLAALCVCALLRPVQASAQVLEIGDDGEARKVGGGWVAETPAAFRSAGPPPAFRAAIQAAAARHDLSPDFLDAVARSESGYDPGVVSPAGAIGIMQLMPATARQLGVDPWKPSENIMGGAAYLRQQLDRFDGAVDLALAAYNAGSGRVVQYGGVPPFRETRAYVATNLDRLAAASLKSTPIDGDLP